MSTFLLFWRAFWIISVPYIFHLNFIACHSINLTFVHLLCLFKLGFSSQAFFSFFSPLLARANSDCLCAFFTLHVTAPHVLAVTALHYFPRKGFVAASAAHVRTATLPTGLGVALSPDSTQSSSTFTLPTVVWRSGQSDEVPESVSFSSSRSEHVLITALSLADNVDDFVVLFLQERCYLFEVAQTSEARFSLARARHAMTSADNCHLVSDSLKKESQWKIRTPRVILIGWSSIAYLK